MVSEALEFGPPLRSVWRTNLMEERESELPFEGKRVELEVGPHEIVTLEVEFDGRPAG